MNEMQVLWAITGLQIKKGGLITVPNRNKNTALVVTKIFDFKETPDFWTGSLLKTIFK